MSSAAPFGLITPNSTYRDVFCDAPLNKLVDPGTAWPSPDRLLDEHESSNNGLSYGAGISGLRTNRKSDGGTDRSRLSLTVDREAYGPSNSYYASVSFIRSIGLVWGYRPFQQQLLLLRAQIRSVHKGGLKVRYWGAPSWPAGRRNHLWHVLVRESADVLSVDDLIGVTGRD